MQDEFIQIGISLPVIINLFKLGEINIHKFLIFKLKLMIICVQNI